MNLSFICTKNSCRSQLAEGWTLHLWSEQSTPYSAGIELHGLNHSAVALMAETGVDISHDTSTHVDDLSDFSSDYVVTVCGHAKENCPVFGGSTKAIHIVFEDAPKRAVGAKSEDDSLNCYRKVRDEIMAFIETLPEEIKRRS